MPRPAPCPLSARAAPISREIERDEQVVLLALRRRLLARLDRADPRDLPVVLDALAAAVTAARAQARRLNDARIVRRGERAQAPGPAPPPALARHACHGAYLGDFADLAAVGRMAAGTCLGGHVLGDLCDRAAEDLALALHLRGALWTLEHGGRVHAFRCYGIGSQTKR